MPAPEELEKLGGLFDTVADRSRPFFAECAKTKFLAVEDFPKAADECIRLARQTLNIDSSGVDVDCLDDVKSAVESGQLDGNLVDALSRFRSSYLEGVLRPAVKSYLNNEHKTISEIEALYTDAVRIDGVLEVVQFLSRVQPKS